MRTLVYSLIIMVLVATVGLGGLFDYLYQAYNFQKENSATLMNDQSLVTPSTSNIDKTMMLEQLGEQISATLNQLDSPKLWLTNWQASHGYQLTLLPSKNIPLPRELLSQIKKGQPLLLETDTDLVFHFYLPKHDSLLLLSAPIQVIKNKDQFVSYMLTIIFYGALLLLFLLWVTPLIVSA
jgi:two-component system OmpR family sensor kinase